VFVVTSAIDLALGAMEMGLGGVETLFMAIDFERLPDAQFWIIRIGKPIGRTAIDHHSRDGVDGYDYLPSLLERYQAG
jgi:hypothetical protein